MKKPLLSLAIAILLLSAIRLSAQEEIPDSPAGKQFQAILNALESDNPESFIEKHFSEKFLNQFTMEDHLSFFRQVKMMHGGFEIQRIEVGTDYELRAIVKGKKQNSWRIIELLVESTPPHKISSFGMDMAHPPSNVEYNGEKFDQVSILQADKYAVVTGDIAEKIDKHLSIMEVRGYSGAVLVAKKGEILIAKGYGYANREDKIPFHTNTAFDIGSIAKQFTGAAILKLEMMGKLSTDDLITKYFKNVPNDKQKIKLHNLLTHSSGLPGAIGYDYEEIDRDDFIKLALETKLLFPVGEKYEYSNVGFAILAAIIEQVTSNSYERFLYDNLFEPSNIHQTGYTIPNWENGQVAHGYRGNEYFGQPNKQNWDTDGPWWHLRGNGGIISTIYDMYNWHLALEGNSVLSEAAKVKYYTPHIAEGPEGDTHYGYGWVITNSSRGTKVYMHNGGNPYFANDCYRYIEDEVFVYIASNNGEMEAIDQSDTILNMIFE